VDDIFENLQRAYENIKKNPEIQERIKANPSKSMFDVGDGTGEFQLQSGYYKIMEDLFGGDTKTSLSSKTDDKTNKQNIVREIFQANEAFDIIKRIENEALDSYFKVKGEINARAAEDFFNSTELQDFYPEILVRTALERFPADTSFDDVMRGIVRKDEVDRLTQQYIDRMTSGMSEGGEVKKGIGSMAREVL